MTHTDGTEGLVPLGEGRALDPRDGRVLQAGAELTRLTSRELALVAHLRARAGSDVPREDLATQVLGQSASVTSRALDAAIARVRRKLEIDPGAPRLLLTAHGSGYAWRGEARETQRPPAPATESCRFTCADGVLDLGARAFTGEDGQPTTLTALEAALLERLARAAGRWLAADELWPERASRPVARRRAAWAMSRLRARLGIATSIQQQRGLGYRLCATREPTPDAHEALLFRIAQHASRVLGVDDCVIYVREGDALRQVAAWGPKKDPSGDAVLGPIELPVGVGIVGAAAAARSAELVRDTREDRRYVRDAYSGLSELAVPIVAGAEVLGVVDSECARAAAYGARERELLISVASVLGAALKDGR